MGPRLVISRALVGRELGRALRDQRVWLSDEERAPRANRHDHLAALSERLGHGALVQDPNRASPVAVAYPERQRTACAPDRAGHHCAAELIRAAGDRARREL